MLVVVYTRDGQALALQRNQPFDFWQSVTGSLSPDEDHASAAARELAEETGLAAEGLVYSGNERIFEIDPRWRHRFGAGVTTNTEYEWRLEIDAPVDIRLNPAEHSRYEWLPTAEAYERFWSWTNKEAIRELQLAQAAPTRRRR